MKRLVEREFPAGTIEAKVSVFLNEAEPFQSPVGAKQRVRARLVGAPLRGRRPWFIPALAMGILTFVALAGAGVWRSKLRPHALSSGIAKSESAPAAVTAPVATALPAGEGEPTTGTAAIPEGPGAPVP